MKPDSSVSTVCWRELRAAHSFRREFDKFEDAFKFCQFLSKIDETYNISLLYFETYFFDDSRFKDE